MRSLASPSKTSLPALSYSSAAILEAGQGDNYYAAKLSSANYAVFRVYKDTTDPAKTRFDWKTYKLNSNPDIIGFGYDDPRDILITDDLRVAYISAKDEFGNDRVLAVQNSSTINQMPSYNVFGGSSSLVGSTFGVTLSKGKPSTVSELAQTTLRMPRKQAA